MKRGTQEQLVWDSVHSRPAGVLQGLDRRAQNGFAALFNGARKGWMHKPGVTPTFGKAEAEWAWPDGWNALKAAGLVDWKLTERPCHPSFGDVPPMVDVDWWITDKGHDVREDDLRWLREVMAARDLDEAKREG